MHIYYVAYLEYLIIRYQNNEHINLQNVIRKEYRIIGEMKEKTTTQKLILLKCLLATPTLKSRPLAKTKPNLQLKNPMVTLQLITSLPIWF